MILSYLKLFLFIKKTEINIKVPKYFVLYFLLFLAVITILKEYFLKKLKK